MNPRLKKHKEDNINALRNKITQNQLQRRISKVDREKNILHEEKQR